jgi:hypothetical protein
MAEQNSYSAVLLHHRKNRINHRLLFGEPTRTIRLDWQRSLAVFQPDQVFGYIRWRGNKHGTQTWRLYVLQTVEIGAMTSVPGVHPGAGILLEASGTVAVKAVFQVIDDHERAGLTAAHFSPCYWRHVHTMVREGLEPHPFNALQVRANSILVGGQ